MYWNQAFLDQLRKAGFEGHNEQEIVEQFLFASLIMPRDLAEQPLTPEQAVQNENSLQPTNGGVKILQ